MKYLRVFLVALLVTFFQPAFSLDKIKDVKIQLNAPMCYTELNPALGKNP